MTLASFKHLASTPASGPVQSPASGPVQGPTRVRARVPTLVRALARLASTIVAGSVVTLTIGACAQVNPPGGIATSAQPVASPTAPGAAPRTTPAPMSFAVFGDTPYSMAEERGLDRMMPALNRAEVEFIVHVGDLKSGQSPCSDELLSGRRRQLEQIRRPFILLPGDNEWTDCHRPEAGRYDPQERLTFWRRHLLEGWPALPAVHGLERQAAHEGNPLALPENRLWHASGVTFIAINLPGSNNNMSRPGTPDTEREQRTEANRRWLRHALEVARARQAGAMVLFIHGNPLFDRAREGPIARRDGFHAFKADLLALAREFDAPLLLVHGDTHSYQFNQPLRDEQGAIVRTAWRLEVPGSPTVGWVKVTIDTRQPNPFRPLQSQAISLEAAP